MSNKFLTRQTAGLDDGTADIYVGSIRLNNIDVSKNLKTDAIGQLVAADVSISEVDNLQTELDFKLNKTVAIFLTQPSTPTTPPVGDFKVYAKDDKRLYTLDSDGLETDLLAGGNPFNQTLNTTNSVEFASIKDNQHNLTLGLNLTPLTNCVQLGGNSVAPTRGTGTTVVGFDAARNVGISNTVVGNSALSLAAASGTNNCVFGSRIGVLGAIGSSNTIVGDFTALSGCGDSNVIVGRNIADSSALVNNILAINAGGIQINPVDSNRIILQGGTSSFNVSATSYNITAGSTTLFGDATSMKPNTNIDAGANFVFSTAVPSLNSHLTNKLYVDTGLNTKLSLSGGTMTGNITALRTNDSNIILGSGAGTIASGGNAVAVGSSSNSAGQDSVAVGKSSSASGGSCIAIGNTAAASTLASIAIGVNSIANSTSIAVGREARATNANSIIINCNAGTILQSSANDQIQMQAGATNFVYDLLGFKIANTNESTSTTTGSLHTAGGLGVIGNINFGGLINGLTAGGGLFAQTSTVVVANTVVETNIIGTGVGSITMPANALTVGTSCVVEAGGVMSCLNNSTLVIRVYCGVSGTTLLATFPTLTIGTSTGRWFGLALYFTIRTIGIAGVASISIRGVYQQNIDVGNELYGTSFHTVNNTTFNSTVSNTLLVSIQWGVASASNTLSNAQFVLTKSY
jgi:hypothetical protein